MMYSNFKETDFKVGMNIRLYGTVDPHGREWEVVEISSDGQHLTLRADAVLKRMQYLTTHWMNVIEKYEQSKE